MELDRLKQRLEGLAGKPCAWKHSTHGLEGGQGYSVQAESPALPYYLR
jgi:hypothetical protein